MSFTKRDVKDRVVQYPRRYKLVEVSDGIYDLIPVTGIVTEEGTPINKAYLQPIEDGLDNALEILPEKAPKSHASSGTTYGLGTTGNYGHVKTINNLTQASHVDGTALSAYQGKILNDLIFKKELRLYGTYTGTANAPFTITIPTDWSQMVVYIINNSTKGQTVGVGFNGVEALRVYINATATHTNGRFDFYKLTSTLVAIRSFGVNATDSTNITPTNLAKLFISPIPEDCTIYLFLKQ